MIIVSDTISIDLLEYITADEYDNSSSISVNTALLWQKEASDIPSKFELLVFLYFT